MNRLADPAMDKADLFREAPQRSPNPLLPQLMRRFEANFDATSPGDAETVDLSWFAAWVLIECPGLRE